MPDRPILLFPRFEQVQATPRHGGPSGIHRPGGQRQGERLTPVFAELQAAFEARRVEVQQSSSGVDPEQVLIFETVGSIDDFIRAVKRVDGLEWMGEIDIDEIEPDEDFFIVNSPTKPLSGRLYLLLTNQRALGDLLSLWNTYKQNEEVAFARGLGRFKEMFKCLKDIRRWGIQDRILDTNLLEYWKSDLALEQTSTVRFEAELWFRNDVAKRAQGFELVASQIAALGGRVVSQCTIPEIAYQAVLGELPAEAIRAITEHPTIQSIQMSSAAGLAASENIMFLRPVGQMAVGKEHLEGDVSPATTAVRPMPSGQPVIALFDGVPMQNHELLADRLIYDDPDSYEADYLAGERCHGTAMASLILHGDLSRNEEPLPRPLYVRPILKPDPKGRPFGFQTEVVPEDVLATDLLHRAVKRLMSGDGGTTPPVAPSVRIISLSIGDLARQFDRVMSPLGRLIDWLSHHYGILFVISAGNHSSTVEVPVDRPTFEALTAEEREKLVVKSLVSEARNRRLRPPAESINGLTVGSTHMDGSSVAHVGPRFDPFTTSLPSPFSAFGSGYRRGIKPDVVYTGGRQWYREPLISTNPLPIQPANSRQAPGLLVAAPGSAPADLAMTTHGCGTSHATALVSRAGSMCYDTLMDLVAGLPTGPLTQPAIGPMIKAMLIHGCSWGEIGDHLSNILQPDHDAKAVKSFISRWLGYGVPDINRVRECTAQRATLLGFGTLAHDQAHAFRLPLPPSLSSVTHLRRLTVSLAWFTPVLSTTQKYRAAKLWFESRHDLTEGRQDADWQAVRRGTTQHEVFEGARAIPFTDGEEIKIQVNCAKDAGDFAAPIPYGLAVTLEVGAEINIPIYEEIKARVAIPVQVQQPVRGNTQ